MRISKKFKLDRSQHELDFVDIDPKLDKRVFVDPVLIGRSSDSWSREVTDTIGSFFQFLINLLRVQKTEEAFKLFENLNEPNETCLGMSRGRPEGRGVGKEDSRKIFESLSESKAVKTGLVSDLEDCVIFVDKFGPDKLSDMTTNIIRGHLIEYTKEQCNLWGIPLRPSVATGKVWNKSTLNWEEKHDEMLVIDDKRIILVPKSIVSLKGIFAADKYHQFDVLEFLKEEHLSLRSTLVQYRSETGKYKGAPFVTKLSLKEDGGAEFSKAFLTDFSLKHKDIFESYKERTKAFSGEIPNQDLSPSENIVDICTALIDELKSIPAGNVDATRFHRLATGILELMFYPNLVRPKIEQEIHDGRKRIDILFNNSAKTGFFNTAPEKFKIALPLVAIECKNYSKDPKNPELDQLAMRFSPQRGQLGLMICRDVSDSDTLIQRCGDIWSDKHGVIIPLWDSDLTDILESLRNKNMNYVDTLLFERAGAVVQKA